MNFATDRPCANPEASARKLIEIANSVETIQDGRTAANGTFAFAAFFCDFTYFVPCARLHKG
jgi:hypothetical protein